MKQGKRHARFIKLAMAAGLSCALLTACGGVTEEMLAERESAIAQMEAGDYEAAVAAFNGLVAEAKSVTEFELDILKYRAEAEYLLGDYAAAAYTYDILSQVDEETAEYCYFGAMALARSGDVAGAEAELAAGQELDPKMEKAGYTDAVMALADATFAAGNPEGAKAWYQGLIDAGRSNTAVYNALMVMAMEAGDYEGALTLAAKGIALGAADAMQELRFNEAVCHEYLAEYDVALELFQNYVSEFGSDARAEHEIAFLKTR